MDNKVSNQNKKGNFLTRRFEAPAWLIITIIIAWLVSAVIENKIFAVLLIVIAVALIVIWLYLRYPTDIKQKEVTLPGLPGYTITLSNIPDNVTPELLPISSDEEERLKGLDTDGVGLITSIAGNLVFYDETKAEVNNFDSPIILTYNFSTKDEEGLLSQKEDLIQKNIIAEKDKVKLIPIYLYTYIPKKERGSRITTDQKSATTREQEAEIPPVWKPFQNFSVDEANKTTAIEFMFWGDQPTGWGTRP
jgi:hypothetical protein